MNIKQRGIAVLASAGLILSLGMSSASAVTVYHNKSYWGKSDGVSQVKYCWNDYNWWEETFQFKKDRYNPCGIRYV